MHSYDKILIHVWSQRILQRSTLHSA